MCNVLGIGLQIKCVGVGHDNETAKQNVSSRKAKSLFAKVKRHLPTLLHGIRGETLECGFGDTALDQQALYKGMAVQHGGAADERLPRLTQFPGWYQPPQRHQRVTLLVRESDF